MSCHATERPVSRSLEDGRRWLVRVAIELAMKEVVDLYVRIGLKLKSVQFFEEWRTDLFTLTQRLWGDVYSLELPTLPPWAASIPVPPCARIGDLVWDDRDGDGLQDAAEPGVPGLPVALIAGSGAKAVKVADAVTDAQGKYLFDGVIPGQTYAVRFGLRPGLHFTLPHEGADDAIDSDADRATGLTPPVAVKTEQVRRSEGGGVYACMYVYFRVSIFFRPFAKGA